MKQLFVARRLLLVTCNFLFVAGLYAQADSLALKRELTLERDYNPVLKDASKINQLPEIKEPEAPQSSVDFSRFTLPYIVSPYLRTIQPDVYFSSPETCKQRGYLNLSAGLPLNIDGDWGYQLLNTHRDYLNIYVSHRSTRSQVAYLYDTGDATMKINDNNAGIFYKHHFEQAKFTAGMQYLNAAFNYYGSEMTLSVNDTYPVNTYTHLNRNQVNHLFHLYAGIESEENDEINYKINFAYNLFRQKYGSLENIKGPVENRYTVDFDLNAPFNSTNVIGLQGFLKSYFSQLPDSADFVNHIRPREAAQKYNYTTVSFNPYFTHTGDDWDVRLGGKIDFQFGGVTKNFLLSPDIRLKWLPADKMQLYLNVSGGINDNSYYNTFFENRYLNPHFRLYDSQTPLDATLGINLLILSNFSLDVFTGYRQTRDEHFYITDYWPGDKKNYTVADYVNYSLMQQSIAPVYMKAKTFKWGASARYAYQDIFNIHLQGIFYNWNCSKLNKDAIYGSDYIQALYPWNKPSFAGNVESGFQFPGLSLRFNLNYQILLGRKSYVVEEAKMKDIHDLSVKSSYSINPMLSVYLVANNLLFQKYEVWYGYPAQNFNIMGGISIKF
ncbi:MAG: TonB-dependent receptor [Dysgonamonadaceae bacterium]|jgi:hypothetical protein|nr:TonB-dependent receptor [Dysgonamonadaceae bacterium]